MLVQPNDASPLVSTYLWLHAGVVDEEPAEEGAAHFLEHMLFKGTPTRGPGKAAAEIEGLGGELNAYTTHDETVLHATVEASQWSAALDVIADMAQNSTIDLYEVERERQVVLEEIRGYAADPDTVLEEATLSALFPGHPYGRPILGGADHVMALSHDAIQAFRRRCHGPDRAILAIAGAVAPDVAIDVAKESFGRWRATGSPRMQFPLPEPRERAVGECIHAPFDTLAVELAWPAMPANHADVAALDVFLGALGTGAASLLASRLQREDDLAADTWSELSLRCVGGIASIGFLPHEGRTLDAIRAALDEVSAVCRRGIAGPWMVRAKDAILADDLFAAEAVDGIAHTMAWYAATHGDPSAQERYRAAVASVTHEQIRDVARRWLAPDRCTAMVLDASIRSAALERVIRQVCVPVPVSRVSRRPTKHVLENGVTVWCLPDETPVVAVEVAAFGGGLCETPRTAGISAFWSRALLAGADELDAGSLAEAIDDVAGTMDAIAGRSAIGLRATFPAAWLREGLDLVGAVLAKPWFDEEECGRVRKELEEEQSTQSDHPEDVADDLAASRLWAGHPWALPALGTVESISRGTRSRLQKWHREQFAADNLVLAVAGGIESADVLDALQPWLEELPGRSSVLSARPAFRRIPGELRAKAGRAQSHLVVSFSGPAISSPNFLALRVAAAFLDGQGGRLFLVLREEQALAYEVWAEAWGGVDGGSFSVGLATEPLKLEQARAALRDELERLREHPPSPEEIARTIRMLTGQIAIGLQRASGRAADAAIGARFGVPWGMEAHRRALGAVDAETVATAIRQVLAEAPVEVIVEPRT